jgi:hypothetical protein
MKDIFRDIVDKSLIEHEIELSKTQISEFMRNPVWLRIVSDLKRAYIEGLMQLRSVDSTLSADIVELQSGLRRIEEVLNLPEVYLIELNTKEEKNGY